jgi:hypothetical protein
MDYFHVVCLPPDNRVSVRIGTRGKSGKCIRDIWKREAIEKRLLHGRRGPCASPLGPEEPKEAGMAIALRARRRLRYGKRQLKRSLLDGFAPARVV